MEDKPKANKRKKKKSFVIRGFKLADIITPQTVDKLEEIKAKLRR